MADLSVITLPWYNLARRGYPRAALRLFAEFADRVDSGDLTPAQGKVLSDALRKIAAGRDAGGAFSERPDCRPKLDGGLPGEKLNKGLNILPVFEALREVSSENRAANVIRAAKFPNIRERALLRSRTDKRERRAAYDAAKGAGAQTVKDRVAAAIEAYEVHREVNRQMFTDD